MDRVRHILSLSGGKDSTALAVYMRDRVPEMEYVFCDTHKELQETYAYLDRLEAYLGKPIKHLEDNRGFDHWLKVFGDFLPSSNMRWCTKMLKLKPFEEYVGDERVKMYVGIRADEDRSGYVSTKPNIEAICPFKDDGIDHAGVMRILNESGLGLPTYYEWRTRSGCYFCFFQRRSEWVGLKEHHPELYELAKQYEKPDKDFTWTHQESLVQMEQPERVAEIRRKVEEERERALARRRPRTLAEAFGLTEPGEPDDEVGCLICHL
jgi:3'-phosphoadenosine 5'-phosphosulfate sulfotransferase (PAPS reductase)/FAD synthetase